MPQNFLSPLEFRFSLKRAPKIEYYCQTAVIPSLSAGFATLPTPFHDIPLTPDKLEYGDFTLNFRIDENLENYLEIYNWIIGISFPETFTSYSNLTSNRNGDFSGAYSDATLSILNSSKNMNIQVKFEDLFPINLTEVLMDVKSTDINYVEATASFKYKRFSISTI